MSVKRSLKIGQAILFTVSNQNPCTLKKKEKQFKAGKVTNIRKQKKYYFVDERMK